MISITNAAKEPHITPLQDSMWHRGMAGIDSCVFNFFENFAAEVSSNNSVKIRSGIGMIQGRYFCVEPSTYDEVTIANGTQGEKRKDLIVCRWTVDEEQKVQSGDWVVIQGTPTTGTPAAPSYTDGDLDAGDLIADMPFYEVTLDGINVTGVAQKFTSLGGIGKFPNPLPISKGGTGATTPAAARAALGGVSIEKVWENPSPTSAFSAQTIELDLSDAEFVDIDISFPNYERCRVQRFKVGEKCFATAGNDNPKYTNLNYMRLIEVKKTGIVFEDGYFNSEKDNNYVKPRSIWKIKL